MSETEPLAVRLLAMEKNETEQTFEAVKLMSGGNVKRTAMNMSPH